MLLAVRACTSMPSYKPAIGSKISLVWFQSWPPINLIVRNLELGPSRANAHNKGIYISIFRIFPSANFENLECNLIHGKDS